MNVLADVADDPRTSANLVDQVNDTTDAKHMWLAPIMHNDVRFMKFRVACLLYGRGDFLLRSDSNTITEFRRQ